MANKSFVYVKVFPAERSAAVAKIMSKKSYSEPARPGRRILAKVLLKSVPFEVRPLNVSPGNLK